MTHRLELVRDLELPHCEGTLTLYRDGEDEPIRGWGGIYTDADGPNDPQAYKGPTPAIPFWITEKIERHPGRAKTFPHAILMPVDLQAAEEDYPNRTFRGPDFFLWHFVSGAPGSSTGCCGPHENAVWSDSTPVLNEIIEAEGRLLLNVIDGGVR